VGSNGRGNSGRGIVWYLLAAMLDNPQAECLTPGFVEATLRDAGFAVERTETMLDEITQPTRARRP